MRRLIRVLGLLWLVLVGGSSCTNQEPPTEPGEALTLGVEIMGFGKFIHQALLGAVRRGELTEGTVRLVGIAGEEATQLTDISLVESLWAESDPGERWSPSLRKRLDRLQRFFDQKELDCTLQPLERFLGKLVSRSSNAEPSLSIVAQLGSVEVAPRTRQVMARTGGRGLGDPPFKGRSIAFVDRPMEWFRFERLLESVGASALDIEVQGVDPSASFVYEVSRGKADLVLVGMAPVRELARRGFQLVHRAGVRPGMPWLSLLVCHRSVLQDSVKEEVLSQVVAQLDGMLSRATLARGAALPGGVGSTALPDVPYLSELSRQLVEAGLTSEKGSLRAHLASVDAASAGGFSSSE